MKKIVRFLTGKQPEKTNNEKAPLDEGASFYSELTVDVLARTLWGEARGEGSKGMEAVAHVILNRVAISAAHSGGYWWGGDIISVCQKPYQFSCWNRADPNYSKLLLVGEDDPHYATAVRISRRAVCGLLVQTQDPTGGATHYHEKSIRPSWAIGETVCATIGRHIFYKLT